MAVEEREALFGERVRACGQGTPNACCACQFRDDGVEGLHHQPVIVLDIRQRLKCPGPIHLSATDGTAIVFAAMEMFDVRTGAADGVRGRFFLDVHVEGVEQQADGRLIDRIHQADAILNRIEHEGLEAVQRLERERDALSSGNGADLLQRADAVVKFLIG